MSKTITVPEGVTPAMHAAATAASEKLAASLKAADAARDGKLVRAYGADVTPAAVRLAKRAADELSGASKSRGGARANVLAVAEAVRAHEAAEVSDKLFVAAAAARMAELAAAAKERRDRKRELADTVNDAGSSLAARSAALEVLAGMEDADARAKLDAKLKRFGAAIIGCRDAGATADVLADMIAAAYGVKLEVSYPAAVPADAATVAA